jgi:hypothetical protein
VGADTGLVAMELETGGSIALDAVFEPFEQPLVMSRKTPDGQQSGSEESFFFGERFRLLALVVFLWFLFLWVLRIVAQVKLCEICHSGLPLLVPQSPREKACGQPMLEALISGRLAP